MPIERKASHLPMPQPDQRRGISSTVTMPPPEVSLGRLQINGLLSRYTPLREFQQTFVTAISNGGPVDGPAIAATWDILAGSSFGDLNPSVAHTANLLFAPVVARIVPDQAVVVEAVQTRERMLAEVVMTRQASQSERQDDPPTATFADALRPAIAGMMGESPVDWSPFAQPEAVQMTFGILKSLPTDQVSDAIDSVLTAFGPPPEGEADQRKGAERQVYSFMHRLVTSPAQNLESALQGIRETYDQPKDRE